MNLQAKLETYSKFAPMTVRDLSGKVREKIIQVDVLVLVPKIEAALRAAYDEGCEDTESENHLRHSDRGVTTGITEL